MEENLINMAKSGDKDAFVDLVNMYQRKLYVIAQHRIDKEEDVKDIVQDTLLQAYTNINTIKNVNSFNGWLTQILLNNCKDYLRVKQRVIFSYDNIENEAVFATNDNFVAIDNVIDVYSVIDLFNKEDKEILFLYFNEGHTTKEISDIINMNESTIRTK